MALSPIGLRGMGTIPIVTLRYPVVRSGSGAVLEAPAVVAGLDDVAMMGQAIEQSRGHLRIAEHARPLTKSEIGGHDHRRPFVELADHVEQKLSARLSERQVAELVENDEVEASEIIGEPPLPACPAFCLQPIDQIDGVEEPAARSG